jgi:uncharacterized protein YebE (UPF0316 family)
MLSILPDAFSAWLTSEVPSFISPFVAHVGLMAPPWETLPPFASALLIFGFRMANRTLSTLRMLFIFRGQRWIVWLLGFSNALLFIASVSLVLGDLNNPWNLFAYAAGFASGSVSGIYIEGKLAPGHSLVRVMSARRGKAILEDLHHANHGATEFPGRGRSGFVSVIHCYIPRRRVQPLMEQILHTDPDAFITSEHVRQLHGGWNA